MSELEITMELDSELALTETPELIENVDIDLGDEIHEILLEYVELIMEEAITNTPSDTGELAESYDIEDLYDEVNVINYAYHFPFVEAKYHMLGKAYALYEAEMDEAIDDAINEYFGGGI